jgi:hypothetical protein
MITLSKISEFLKSTFGETVKVVFGILIALQINTWSDQAKQNTEEVRILTNLKQDLLNDVSQLKSHVQNAGERQKNIDSVFTILHQPEKYSTDKFLKLNFALADENHFDLSSGAFDESMAAGTIDCIRDHSVRQQIFNYYRITKRNYTDKNTIKQIYENIFPHFFEILVPSQEYIGGQLKKPTHLPNLNVGELALNKGYIAILTLKYRTEHHQILSWKEYMSLANVLLEHIEQELKEKT